jgi:organic hydroperoxide reductase OsmC/OhrA
MCEVDVVWMPRRRDPAAAGLGAGATEAGDPDPRLPVLVVADQRRLDSGRDFTSHELLLGAASAFHMLWYLHRCREAGIEVLEYEDRPRGTVLPSDEGPGGFTALHLRPLVAVALSTGPARVAEFHERAPTLAALSEVLGCPVRCEPEIVRVADTRRTGGGTR